MSQGLHDLFCGTIYTVVSREFINIIGPRQKIFMYTSFVEASIVKSKELSKVPFLHSAPYDLARLPQVI